MANRISGAADNWYDFCARSQEVQADGIFQPSDHILLAIVIMGAAIVTVLITAGSIGANALPEGWLEPQIRWLADSSGGTQVLVVTVSILVAVLMLAVILGEIAVEYMLANRRHEHEEAPKAEQGGP